MVEMWNPSIMTQESNVCFLMLNFYTVLTWSLWERLSVVEKISSKFQYHLFTIVNDKFRECCTSEEWVLTQFGGDQARMEMNMEGTYMVAAENITRWFKIVIIIICGRNDVS